MCLAVFLPTLKRLVVFLFFLGLVFSGILWMLSALRPLQLFAGLPLFALGYVPAGIVLQIVYSYIMACIYAAAYVRIEAAIRKSYPHMNDVVKKKRKK